MSPQKRRQSMLLGLLVAAAGTYVWLEGIPILAPATEIESLPPIDVRGVQQAWMGVSTVGPNLIAPPRPDSQPDRNLFQYGVMVPPPLTPEQEKQRRVQEALLMEAEKKAREEKEKQDQLAAEQQKALAEAAALAAAQAQPVVPEPPPPPPKPEPPDITFRLVGIIGTPQKKIGTFLDGDNVVLAKKGDVINGKFKILDIGVQWALVGYTDPAFADRRQRIEFTQ